MEEELLNDILCKLDAMGVSTELLKEARVQLSDVISHYSIETKCNAIVVYSGIPIELQWYFVAKKTEGMSESTLKRIAAILGRFFEFVGKEPKDVIANDLRMWILCLQRSGKTSDRTIDGYRNIVSGFYRWLFNEGYIVKNPMVNVPKIRWSVERRPYLRLEQISEIRNVCSIREKAIFEFYLSTGCRCTEITTVKVEDIDFEEQEVKIYNEKSDRFKTSYLSDGCKESLLRYMHKYNVKSGYLFFSLSEITGYGNKLTKAGVASIIKGISKKCGIYFTPGIIRHTFATQALNNGVDLIDVQILMDHMSPRTTLVYAERFSSNVKEAHKKAFV